MSNIRVTCTNRESRVTSKRAKFHRQETEQRFHQSRISLTRERLFYPVDTGPWFYQPGHIYLYVAKPNFRYKRDGRGVRACVRWCLGWRRSVIWSPQAWGPSPGRHCGSGADNNNKILRCSVFKDNYGSGSSIVQELCESRGGRPGLSVLTSLLVSVHVKIYCTVLRHWSQLVPNMSHDIWGH